MRGLLLLLTAGLMVPFVVFELAIALRGYRDTRARAFESELEEARAGANLIDAYARGLLRQEESIGVWLGVLGLPASPEVDAVLGSVAREYPAVRHFGWLAPDGTTVASSMPGAKGTRLGASPSFQAILAGQTWAASDLIADPENPAAATIVVSRGLRDAAGRVLGVVQAEVDTAGLGVVFRQARPEGSMRAVFDHAGRVVYREPGLATNGPRPAPSQDPLVIAAVHGQERTGTFEDEASPDRLCVGAAVPVPVLGWAVRTGTLVDRAMGPAWAELRLHLGLALLFLLTGVVTFWFVSRRITVPLANLERQASALQAGAPVEPVPTDVVEVDSLQAALRRTGDELLGRQRALQRAHEEAERAAAHAREQAGYLDAVFEAAGDALIIVDAEERIVRMNAAARGLFDIAEGAAPGERVEAIAFEDLERKPISARASPPLRALEGGIVAGQVLYARWRGARAGSWVSASAAPIRSSAGERVVGAVCSLSDVTRIRELQEAQQDLVRMISHDLRSPLSIITAQAQMLQRRPGDDAGVRGRAESIQTAAHRLDAMIQEMVDAARIEGGVLELHLQPIELKKFVGELLGRLRGSLQTSRVSVHAAEGLAPAAADPDRLERILVNLISNALKYSPAESGVEVSLEPSASGIACSVLDRGPGIAAEDLEHVFERYFRGRGHERVEGRIGLGLYTTKKLVEAHGGTIAVESRPGGGTTFRFVLPLYVRGARERDDTPGESPWPGGH